MNEVYGATEADIERALSEDQELRPFERTLVRILQEVGWAVGSIILALLVVALIMIATGYNPIIAYSALIRGALMTPDQILWNATPLILTGLSVALAFKAGLFNIGAEGQLYMGSIVASIIGIYIFFPPVIHPIICILAGVFFGALWGLIAGLLKAYRGAHEVVTTMMLSYIAILLTEWLVTGPIKEPGSAYPQSPPLQPTALLPHLLGSPFLHAGIFVSIGCAIGVWFFLNRTVTGYEIRAVGKNLTAAEAAGINSKRMIVLALAMAGGLAGLAGVSEILGYYRRFIINWSGGLGFDGITVAVLGLNNPFGVIFAALFFGFLRAGALSMQTLAGVPVEMVNIIQGLVVLFIAAPKIIQWLARRNIDYAKWMVEEPKNAIPIFLTAIFALIGSLIGLSVGFANILVDFVLSAQMLTIGFLALIAFIGILMKQSWGVLAEFLTSIGLIIMGVLALVFQLGTLTIPLLVLGVIGIVFSLISSYLLLKKGILLGGAF